jgi:hypothetical protein
MNAKAIPIDFAGSQFGQQRHVCALFHGLDEQYRALLPFIREGFECGDRAFHVVDPGRRKEHLQRLESVGIDTAAAESSGQLTVYGWNDAHIDPEGRFDQHRMLVLIEEELKRRAARGFGVSRSIANMEWALEDLPGVEDLIEYESRLNYILPRYKDPVICVYDIAKFNGAVILDILRTHPMVIIGGTLQENPFFVPPDDFLRELREMREVQNP